jgi:tetratricopeptide (TPR) repeat protein
MKYEGEKQYSWIVNGVALLLIGGLVGYIASSQSTRSASSAVPAASAPAAGGTPVIDEGALRAYRDILARDPRNAQAAISAGNLLYDAHRYVEAIPFYQQALAVDGHDINVSTDLGTALWYAGRPDEALAQYDTSLAINPTHPQTLFNVGVVRADGKHDYAGAIAAWDKLLATTPTYANAAEVQRLIADAMSRNYRRLSRAES